MEQFDRLTGGRRLFSDFSSVTSSHRLVAVMESGAGGGELSSCLRASFRCRHLTARVSAAGRERGWFSERPVKESAYGVPQRSNQLTPVLKENHYGTTL